MVDNYNIIKPVESLQHVGGLTAAKRRQQRKKRQGPNEREDKHNSDENELDSSIEDGIESRIGGCIEGENSIDFRA